MGMAFGIVILLVGIVLLLFSKQKIVPPSLPKADEETDDSDDFTYMVNSFQVILRILALITLLAGAGITVFYLLN